MKKTVCCVLFNHILYFYRKCYHCYSGYNFGELFLYWSDLVMPKSDFLLLQWRPRGQNMHPMLHYQVNFLKKIYRVPQQVLDFSLKKVENWSKMGQKWDKIRQKWDKYGQKMRQKWDKMRQKLSNYCPKLVETPCRNLSLKVIFFQSTRCVTRIRWWWDLWHRKQFTNHQK